MKNESYKERLKNYSQKADDSDWIKMQQMLDADKDDDKPFIIWKWVGLLSLLLLTIIVLFNINGEVQIANPIVEENIIVNQPKIESSNQTKEYTDNASEKSVDSHNTSSSKNHSKTSINNSEINSNNSIANENIIESTSTEIKESHDLVETQIPETLKYQNQTISTTKTNTSKTLKPSITKIVDPEAETNATKEIGNQSIPLGEQASYGLAEKDSRQTFDHSSPIGGIQLSSLIYNRDKAMLTLDIDKLSEDIGKATINPVQMRKKWALVGTASAFYALWTKGNANEVQAYTQNFILSYHFDLGLKRRMNNSWSAEAGLSYLKMRFKATSSSNAQLTADINSEDKIDNETNLYGGYLGLAYTINPSSNNQWVLSSTFYKYFGETSNFTLENDVLATPETQGGIGIQNEEENSEDFTPEETIRDVNSFRETTKPSSFLSVGLSYTRVLSNRHSLGIQASYNLPLGNFLTKGINGEFYQIRGNGPKLGIKYEFGL